MADSTETAETAARIGWLDVAEPVRRALEDALGSPVEESASEGAGHSPSFAARCRLADGRLPHQPWVEAELARPAPVARCGTRR